MRDTRTASTLQRSSLIQSLVKAANPVAEMNALIMGPDTRGIWGGTTSADRLTPARHSLHQAARMGHAKAFN